MTCFAVGDRAIIRYGKRQGQPAIILQCQSANVYQVRTVDGLVLYYSGKGLDREGAAPAVPTKC